MMINNNGNHSIKYEYIKTLTDIIDEVEKVMIFRLLFFYINIKRGMILYHLDIEYLFVKRSIK